MYEHAYFIYAMQCQHEKQILQVVYTIPPGKIPNSFLYSILKIMTKVVNLRYYMLLLYKKNKLSS